MKERDREKERERLANCKATRWFGYAQEREKRMCENAEQLQAEKNGTVRFWPLIKFS